MAHINNIISNPEQAEIEKASQTGKNGKVVAGAGTGKTTLLRKVVKANPTKKILYIAFNRSVADEAEAMFAADGSINVLSRNYHRLAYRHCAKQIQRRGGKYPSSSYLANVLGINSLRLNEEETLSKDTLAVAVKESIGNFCKSADRKPTSYHVGRTSVVRSVEDQYRGKVVDYLLPIVTKAWNDIANPNGSLPYMPGRGDGCYVKLWSLSDPQLGYDMVLLDEAQDTNAAVAHVVNIQKSQIIMVGDSAQAIYGWNGAIDAMEKFEADWTLPLQQSFRFGQAIADQANRWLALVPAATIRIKGFDKIDSQVTELEAPQAILCRTNAGCIESALRARQAGQTVALAGGVGDIESFTKAAEKLLNGETTDHPELAAFKTWGQVKRAVENGDADFGTMVRLIEEYGTEVILGVCSDCKNIDPKDADVTISTAHKAKGLEWDSVRIHTDFQPSKDDPSTINVAEAMLIYVSVTRARRHLDISALSWLDRLERSIASTLAIV